MKEARKNVVEAYLLRGVGNLEGRAAKHLAWEIYRYVVAHMSIKFDGVEHLKWWMLEDGSVWRW